jgi:hypothetical protein
MIVAGMTMKYYADPPGSEYLLIATGNDSEAGDIAHKGEDGTGSEWPWNASNRVKRQKGRNEWWKSWRAGTLIYEVPPRGLEQLIERDMQIGIAGYVAESCMLWNEAQSFYVHLNLLLCICTWNFCCG